MTTEGTIVLVGGLAVLACVLHLFREGRELRNAWRKGAHDAGVQVTDEKTWGLAGMVGRAGRHRVLINEVRTRRGTTGTRIVIEGSSGITLRRETLGTAFEKNLLGPEIQLGDEAFDREVYVRGSARLVRALLDAEARTQLRGLLGGWVSVDGGRDATKRSGGGRGVKLTGWLSDSGFEAEVSLTGGHLQAEFWGEWNEKLRLNLDEVLTALLAVARKLEPPANDAQRIADNNRSEPEWRVRRENLIMLTERSEAEAPLPPRPGSPTSGRRASSPWLPSLRLRSVAACFSRPPLTRRSIAPSCLLGTGRVSPGLTQTRQGS